MPKLAEQILDESGYTAMWQADKSADSPGRLENLKELVRSMEEFETLAASSNTSASSWIAIPAKAAMPSRS